MAKITVSGIAGGPHEFDNAKDAFDLIQSESYFRSIGEFIFRFSQLEYQLKSTLARYLNLRGDQFDVVVGPYDFAVLCTVAEKTIKLDVDEQYHPSVKSFFNKCRELNDTRNIVAHGRWSVEGARHASRRSLEAKMHFESPAKLAKATSDAKKLLDEFGQMGAIVNS